MKVVGSKSGIHSPEFKKKKDRIRNLKLGLWIALLVCIIALPIYLLRTKHFLIASVEVSGNAVTKDEDIETVVSRDLSGDDAWIFPKSNDVLYPRAQIESDLLAAIPRLNSVKVSLKDMRSLSVAVTERVATSLYCTDVSDPSAPAGCSLVDESGYVFSEAPAFSDGVYLVYSNASSTADAIGTQVLPPSEFRDTTAFVKELGTLGAYPRVFLIKNDEYHAILENGADIMWEAAMPFEDVYANMRAFLSSPSISSQEDFFSRILYLDLRFQDKIFYKYRDE